MVKTFEGVFELFDLEVKRLRNGNRLKLVFESTEDLETEKKLIDFRGAHVTATLTQQNSPDEITDFINIEDSFEMVEIKCRPLRNGDKLRFVLEQEYRKEKELQAVGLRYENCKIFLKTEQLELDFEDDGEEEPHGLFVEKAES